jgi:putative hydrolase of the HAD superfamily
LTVSTVIFDLDGVIRNFEPYDAIEEQYGLALGTLMRTAFEPDLIEPTITGRWEHDAWIAALGDRLASRHGPMARDAAAAFASIPAFVDESVIDLAQRLRRNYVVALLTNGTTRVETELEALGVDTHFDHVFNSARIGYAKPDVRVFEHVVRTIACEPAECIFTDDSLHKLAGATELGMRTIHFTDAIALETQLREWGVRC